MKNKLLLIWYFIVSLPLFTYAQDASSVIRSNVKVDEQILMGSEYRGKNFVFTIGVGIGADGKIDTIVHSESPVFKAKIIDFEKVRTGIYKNRKVFAGCKNQFLILAINLARGDADPKDYPDIKDPGWMQILINSSKIQPRKKLVTLEPVLLVIGG